MLHLLTVALLMDVSQESNNPTSFDYCITAIVIYCTNLNPILKFIDCCTK